MVLPACTPASILLETLLENRMQATGCSRRSLWRREDVAVDFAALSVPFVCCQWRSETLPLCSRGSLLQPAQAGRCRVTVPSAAPPPAPVQLIQCEGRKCHSSYPGPRQGQALPGSCLPQTPPAAPAMDRWYLGESPKPALSFLRSGDHPLLSNTPIGSPELWEKQKWERQAVLIKAPQ